MRNRLTARRKCPALRQPTRSLWKLAGILAFLQLPASGAETPDWAEGVDLNRIPDASSRQIDFAADIRPLIEKYCLRCHGDTKPRSGFRLTSRDEALNSGDYGENFVEGSGLQSPFLHFAAHAVEDWEMPPPGEGDAMTRDELALVRAWIDQGIEWPESSAATVVTTTGTLSGRVWSVDGNRNQFRQLHGFREDDSVGLSAFSLRHPTPEGGLWTLDGSVWTHPEEYRIAVGYDAPEGAWFRTQAEQWLSFDSTTGGYAPDFTIPSFTVPGRFERTHNLFTLEGGIRQDSGPNVYVGYEYQSVNGNKASLAFGPAADTLNGAYTQRALRPSVRNQENSRHELTLRIDSGESEKLYWDDEARIEWVEVDEATAESGSFTPGANAAEQRVDRRNTWDSLRGSNSIRLEKNLPRRWLLSAGHSFSLMEGQSVFTENTVILNGNMAFQGPLGQGMVLNQHSQMGNLNLHGGQWENGLSFTAGLQFDWLTQDGSGLVVPFPGAAPQSLDSGWDQTRFTESLSLSYKGLKKQVFYADLRFQQMGYDQSEFLETQVHRLTEATHHRRQYTTGWRYRPNAKTGLHLRARFTENETDYDHPIDQKFSQPGNGYSAFLRERDLDTLDLEARVSLKPHSGWHIESHYQWSTTDFSLSTDPAVDFAGNSITPGGRIDAASYDQHSAGSSISWSPSPRLNGLIHGSVTHWDMNAWANAFPGVTPYRGWTWWTGTRWNYVLNSRTDLSAWYNFSAALFDDGTSGFAFQEGLDYSWRQAGVGLRHRINPQVQTFAEYALSIWDQPSLGGAQDFEAHGVFVGLNWQLQVSGSNGDSTRDDER